MSGLRLLFILVAGMLLGWATAQKVIAIDCEHLGAFFDGSKIHRCVPAPVQPAVPASNNKDTTYGN